MRRGLLISLVAACFVISGALTTPAYGREAKQPGAKRGKKKGQNGQAAGEKKKGKGGARQNKRGKGGAIRLAMLNDKKIEALYGKLDADSSGTVSLEEFKALPTVLQELAKEAAEKAKARGGKKKPGGAKEPGKKRKGGKKKKKDPTQ